MSVRIFIDSSTKRISQKNKYEESNKMTIPAYKDKQLRSLIQKQMKFENRLIFTCWNQRIKKMVTINQWI